MASLLPRPKRRKPIRARLIVGAITYEILPYEDAIFMDGKRVPALVYYPTYRPNRGRIIVTHHTSNAMLGQAFGEAIRLGVEEMMRRRRSGIESAPR